MLVAWSRETNNLSDDSARNKQFYVDLFAMHTLFEREKTHLT
jgi:hypothetical protein